MSACHAGLLADNPTPFEGQITYDGRLQSAAVSFGPRLRRAILGGYRRAKEREGIITSLPPAARSNEQRAQAAASTAKTLQAFRTFLLNVGLGPKRAQEHVGTIEAFAQAVLLKQDPPRGLLEMTAADLQAYLRDASRKPTVTSFKRFVRFLAETGQKEDKHLEVFRQVLKQTEADPMRG